MKRRTSRSASRRVSLAAALGLLATIVLADLTGEARAATEADLVELIQCTNDCRSDEGACSAGCCGRIFCRKSCLSSCAETRISCEGSCYDELEGPSSGAFFETGNLRAKGRLVQVSGPLQCPEGAVATIGVTVTQSPGIIARGQARVACQNGDGAFTVRAVMDGRHRLEAPSTVTACALAQIRIGARDLEALQWCRDVSVLPAGAELEE